MRIEELDLTELREMWQRRRQRAAAVRRRTDPRGMTRPLRDADERAALREIGEEGPFQEVETPGWREWRAGAEPGPGSGPQSPHE